MWHSRMVSAAVLAAGSCVLSTSDASAFVITPMEVFADCTSAKTYRDKELPKKLDTELKRYRNGVQTRVDETIVEFRASLEKSKIDLTGSTAKQRKEVSIAAGKFFASLLLKNYASKMKGPWKESYDQLSNGQKQAVDVIAAKTNGLGELTFDAARGKQVEIADALKPYADGAIEALSWALGPASKGLVEIVKGGTDTSVAYLDVKPDIDFASQQVEFWRGEIDKLIANSPNAKIEAINAAKRAIDKVCGA
ncbi:hypothetical protein ACCT03_34435 [Rhizobium johnstonii]|uniref:hypothetical protein n=1 Tax=Rhizobium johnstonii TaxID=3019933 RepID=UPI003F95CD71